MSFNTLTPAAVSSEARLWAGSVWRMVEVQHIASTMKIVDNDAEQDLLETLLEGSKPAQPASALVLDYLLATPFRYNPLRGGSRFRSAQMLLPGRILRPTASPRPLPRSHARPMLAAFDTNRCVIHNPHGAWRCSRHKRFQNPGRSL